MGGLRTNDKFDLVLTGCVLCDVLFLLIVTIT